MSTPTTLVGTEPSSTDVPPSSVVNNPPGSTGPPSGNNSPAGSELYLFTFLTTLLLLLGVSCAIIIRSLILRRRFRRRVQEAIANGVLVPGLMTEPTPRPLGEKPKMWNVWIGDPKNQLASSAPPQNEDGNSAMDTPARLTEVLPVSATKLNAPVMPTSFMRPPGPVPSHSRAQGPTVSRSFYGRIIPRSLRPIPGSPANGTATPPQSENRVQQAEPESQTSSASASTGTSTPDPSNTSANTVQVSLLIAMPSAARSQYAAYVYQSNSSDKSTTISSSPTRTEAQPHPLSDTSEPAPQADSEMTTSPAADSPKKHAHRLSESSSAKGKAPAYSHSHPHPHTYGAWSHLEEGEIPYMELGIFEVAMEEKKSGEQQQLVNGTAGGGSR